MNEIVGYIDVISKSLLRISFGIALIWAGFTIHNLSKNKDKESTPVYITQKDYNENEKAVLTYMDSVMHLTNTEKLRLVKHLAEEYNR